MPVAWITGGARRLGKSIALSLAERGFDVCFTYNTSVAPAARIRTQIEALGRKAYAEKCDVSNPVLLVETLERFATHFGIADVIVSNAGIFPHPLPIAESTEEELQHALAVNTIPLLTIARTYYRMCSVHAVTGRIVSIGSLGSTEVWKDRLAYNVSKAALATLAKGLARQLAPTIAVNVVAPGAISIPDDVTENDSGLASVNRIPMGRYGTAEDVSDAVWYFATCSSYITGQTITVDGGYGLVR